MHTIRALLLGLAIPVIVLSIFVVTVFAVPAGKVTLCHFASHKYVEVTVSANAQPAHLAHGDLMLDEYGDCP